MSNELTITREDAGETNYVVVRRVSDAYAWDVTNTQFEAWDDGSIGDYDVVLTDAGGGLYQGDFPTSIPSGTHVILFYHNQVGGSPAITDTLLLTVDTTWTGTALSGSSSVTLDSRALTTLASVKRSVDLVSDITHDVFLTELINMMSDKIERKASRRFAAANYVEIINGDGEPVQVRHWPLIRVLWCRYNRNCALNVSYSGSDVAASVAVQYDEEGANGQVYLWSIAADGTETTNAVTFASNPTLSTLATAITAVSDWTGTKMPTGDHPADSLMPMSGVDAKNQTASVDYYSTYDLEHETTPRIGMISVRGKRAVKYRGGYETIPDDIAHLCNKLVTRAFKMRNTNEGIKSESIPDYSYTLASQVELTADDMKLLEPYCVVGVG